MAAKKKAKKAAKKSKVGAKKSAAKKTAKKGARKAASAPAKNAIVHWEIQSQNPGQLHKFYTDALGWKINTDNPMKYGMVASGGRDGINGGIGGSGAPGSRVLVYASVPNISPTLKKIETLGGRTIMPRTDIGPVIMALYEDPEGNVMGLIEG